MQKIVNIVKQKIDYYIGQKELHNNSGFKEQWYEQLMRKMGWKKYQSWCAYAAEAVWKEAYTKIGAIDVVNKLDMLFSASAVQTYKNFIKAGYPHGTIPRIGALAVWQLYKNGKPDWRGHIGVVYSTSNNFTFISGEGNTNKGKSRNGEMYNKNVHYIKEEKVRNNSLRFIGFIYLTDYLFKENMKKTSAYAY